MVLIRHFGSGRYLAVNQRELDNSGIVEALPNSPLHRGSSSFRSSSSIPDLSLIFTVELVDIPGPMCLFTLDAANEVTRNLYVPSESPCVCIQWTSPTGSLPLYLSCQGISKGRGSSMQLHWSTARYAKDAIRVSVFESDPWMLDCDVVGEHISCLQQSITSRCRDFVDVKVAAMVCSQCQQVLTDMIYFVSKSPQWRTQEARLLTKDVLQ